MKLKLLKTEDGEIFVLNLQHPKFLVKVNTIVPFDVDFILEDLFDKKELDQYKKEIEQFVRNKIKYDEL